MMAAVALMTAAQFMTWVATAPRGAVLQYFTGHLAHAALHRREIADLRQAVQRAAVVGLVEPLQRPGPAPATGWRNFEYLVLKR